MDASMPLARRVLKQVSKAARSEHEFSVVTYNILADHWIRRHSLVNEIYPFCPLEFKTRAHGRNSHRHRLLLAELRWLDTDILCLQEVDTAYFTDILKDELTLLGYEALYVESFDRPEGVALAFKRDKFQLAKNSKVVMNDLAQRTFKQCDVPLFDSAFLLAGLRHTVTNNLLVIGVAHLPWGKLLKTVMQVCEIALVTQAMDDLIRSMKAQGEQVAHILCGDFNIEPHFPAYEFLKEGRLTDKEFGRLKTVDYIYFGDEFPDEQPTKIHPNQLWLLNKTKAHLHNPLTTLRSAYKTVMGTEPQFTNHEGGGNVWTLDYIWFDANSLNATAALETVSKSVVEPYGGLPNKFFPSDHVSLKAYFKFVGKRNIPDN